ncbi:FBP domain-containing protein [Actinomycetospora sp. CA-101289]|uniref:FBP domain-containing protein n=1 Tax=Actinomycetospora sp. CA-101289 TaxID=3239893 RepID=UPI003D97C082
MHALTADAVRRSMINCSKGDAQRMTLADDVVGTDLDEVEFVGWRDPRMPQRAYLVSLHEGVVTGVLLRPAAGGGRRRTAMCALCRTTRSDGAVTLHTAPRAGAAGREGNSVGTYICDDLACPAVTRLEKATPTVAPDLSHPVDERVAALRVRVDTFLAAVHGRVDAARAPA